jgi:hypothetical protein
VGGVGLSGIANNVFYSMFILILTFLIITNYEGMVAIMKQGGASLSSVTYTLQGRGKAAPSGY